MSESEQRQIASSPNPAQAFMRLWTMKESLLKLTGEGISDDLRHLLECPGHHPPAYEFDTRVYPRFVCTVCAERGAFISQQPIMPSEANSDY
jgi:4'-phosphopantetheinyl transferase